MNMQKIRMSLALAVLALSLLITNVTPAAAQGWTGATATPITFKCEKNGNYYPLGTVLHYVLPYPEPIDVYMRCELKAPAAPGAGLKAVWVIYGTNPN